MTQPAWCDEGCLAYCSVPDDPPEPAKPHTALGWYALLAMVLILAIAEFIAWKKHWRTPSQNTQGLSKAHKWFRWIGMVGFIVLAVHLFFGGPI